MSQVQEDILRMVREERNAQDAKWGPQSRPCVPPEFEGTENMTWHLGLLSEQDAKELVNYRQSQGTLTWAHVAVEELCETVNCDDDEERLVELVQTAAVLIAWAEDLQTRINSEKVRDIVGGA